LLVQHFLERAQRESGVSHTLSDDSLRALMGYDWPGNVRELESAIQRACALSSGPILHMRDLPTQLHDYGMHGRLRHLPVAAADAVPQDPDPDAPGRRIVSIAELEKEAILGTIRELKGDKLMAAKLLGIGKTTLYRKLKEYGLGDGLEDDS
jgi:DNA-binding NtrC family response regulator